MNTIRWTTVVRTPQSLEDYMKGCTAEMDPGEELLGQSFSLVPEPPPPLPQLMLPKATKPRRKKR